MDMSDIYYILIILDLRLKGDLLLNKIIDKEAVQMIINTIQHNILDKYYLNPNLEQLPDYIDILFSLGGNTKLRLFRYFLVITVGYSQCDIEDYFLLSCV